MDYICCMKHSTISKKLTIGNITMVKMSDGSFHYEFPSSVDTQTLERFKLEYKEEIKEFKK